MSTELIKEAIVVGIATVIIGQIVGFTMGKYVFQRPNIKRECKDWNKNNVMEWSLFITGFLIHILCEYFGINKWYCRNGSACKIT